MYLLDPTGGNGTVGDEDRPLNVEEYTPLLKERQEQQELVAQSQHRSTNN